MPLPERADQVVTDEARCDDLGAQISLVSPILAKASAKVKQTCYLPRHMREGRKRSPLVGRTSVRGLWLASGHCDWGVQNGPGTGLLMSEFIFDGEPHSTNIDELDPQRYGI